MTSNPAISPAFFVACFCLSVKYAGTVITTFFIFWPRNDSALSFNLFNILAEICSGEYFFVPFELTSIKGLPLLSLITLYEKLTKAKRENKQIITLIPKIDSIEIRECLNHIHDTVDKIIKEIEKNPRKEKNIKNFFDYYLPVLVKITVRYDEIENQRLVSSEGKSFMKKADLMIKNTKDAFDTILASLYQKDIMDADAEMKIYDMMMNADGITSGELVMKGVKNEK